MTMLSVTDQDAVDRVANVLMTGGVVVMPTDTVYGIMASVQHPPAIARIFSIKGRSSTKPLAVLVCDLHQALQLAWFPREAMDHAENGWPGPLTLVLERTPNARSLDLGGDGRTIGLRHPDHDFLVRVIERVGPIAATSANRAGQDSGRTAHEIAADFKESIDLYVDGGRLGTEPSRVISLVDGMRQLR